MTAGAFERPRHPSVFLLQRKDGEYVEVLDLFKPLSEIPEMDTSYFQPWTLDKLYQVEPGLATIAAQTVAQRWKRQYQARRTAYVQSKREAWELIGWYARDPRLRSSGAWDCYFRYILGELRI